MTHSGRKLSMPELPTAVGNFLMDFSPVKAQRFYNSIT
jgi:hypothetical protein